MSKKETALLNSQIEQQKIEEKRLQSLIEKYKDHLGDFDLISVNNNAGYILQSKRHLPMAGNDWLIFDYDDTLAAYTQSKGPRLELFLKYFNKLNIEIDDKKAKEIMDITDDFARWEEHKGEGKHYHVNSHMSALSWSTNKIKSNPLKIDDEIQDIKSTLDRIKKQLNDSNESQKDDPFYLKNKKLILRNDKRPWNESIEQIFMKSMISPPNYSDTISAGVKAGSPKNSVHRTNIGIFTYGDPYFQLLKTFELMKNNQELPISQIWLTRVPKGDYIIQASQTGELRNLEQEYIAEGLQETGEEGPSYGSGYVLSQHPHIITMIDDDPKQLTSIFESNEYLKRNTGAQFVVIRTIRANTKAEKKEWQIETKYGVLDFTSESFNPNDISKVILINRYLSACSHLGTNHINVIKLKKELDAQGIKNI